MTSLHRFGVSFHLLFSLSRIRAFCLEKSGVIHPTTLCPCFPSFGKSSLFTHLFMYSFFSLFFLLKSLFFVGATARHRQHTDNKGSARRRVQRKESTNIVPEEEERRKKMGGGGGGGGRREQYQQFHQEVSWDHRRPSIDRF